MKELEIGQNVKLLKDFFLSWIPMGQILRQNLMGSFSGHVPMFLPPSFEETHSGVIA